MEPDILKIFRYSVYNKLVRVALQINIVTRNINQFDKKVYLQKN